MANKPAPLPKSLHGAKALQPYVATQLHVDKANSKSQSSKVVSLDEASIAAWSAGPADLEDHFIILFLLLHAIPDRVPGLHFMGKAMLHLNGLLGSTLLNA